MISPIEVVKIQQQVHPSRGLRDIAREVRNVAGMKGFTRGFTTTLSRLNISCGMEEHCFAFREPVAFCCYFSSFEILTKGRKDNNGWVFFAGGIAGICSWITTYPQVGPWGMVMINSYNHSLLCLGCHQVKSAGGWMGRQGKVF